MDKAKKIMLLGGLLLGLFLTKMVYAEDYPGSKDHPLLSRYPGSVIFHYDQKQFDEYYLLLGPVRSTSDKGIESAKSKRLEGKVTRISYGCPKGRSTFEIYRNYEFALKRAGFDILFEGKGKEVRGVYSFLEKKNKEFLGGWSDPDRWTWYYISGTTKDKSAYVSIFVTGPGYGDFGARAIVAIVEPKEMEIGLITASHIASELKAKGRIALYGIYFDFDKADIKPQSEPTIKEIARFLKENPNIRIYIVGHTDNVGTLEYNLNLSKRRAEAVVKELTTKYGITQDRLKAFGVGPLAPVATNDTEEGRAKNRRVEIVKE